MRTISMLFKQSHAARNGSLKKKNEALCFGGGVFLVSRLIRRELRFNRCIFAKPLQLAYLTMKKSTLTPPLSLPEFNGLKYFERSMTVRDIDGLDTHILATS